VVLAILKTGSHIFVDDVSLTDIKVISLEHMVGQDIIVVPIKLIVYKLIRHPNANIQKRIPTDDYVSLINRSIAVLNRCLGAHRRITCGSRKDNWLIVFHKVITDYSNFDMNSVYNIYETELGSGTSFQLIQNLG
jgi:hypothetical protein